MFKINQSSVEVSSKCPLPFCCAMGACCSIDDIYDDISIADSPREEDSGVPRAVKLQHESMLAQKRPPDVVEHLDISSLLFKLTIDDKAKSQLPVGEHD